MTDNMMFGIDPETLTSGKEHTVMPWFRSWRLTYIFVSIDRMKDLRTLTDDYNSERAFPFAGDLWTLRSWKNRWLLPGCTKMEDGKPFMSTTSFNFCIQFC